MQKGREGVFDAASYLLHQKFLPSLAAAQLCEPGHRWNGMETHMCLGPLEGLNPVLKVSTDLGRLVAGMHVPRCLGGS